MKQTLKTKKEALALLTRHRQEHLLRWWNDLSEFDRRELLNQLSEVDFDAMDELIERHVRKGERSLPVDLSGIAPPDRVSLDGHPDRARFRMLGEEAIRKGEVAVFLVAGGQASRLGIDAPKGTYPIGPVSGKSFFQLFAEKLRATAAKYETVIPWIIMTSDATDAATKSFFAEKKYFGYPKEEIVFLKQGNMPAVDLSGKLLLSDKHRLALSPNGHGGAFTAMGESGLLEKLRSRGIRHLFYFQVDNPLGILPDPEFVGLHVHSKAKMSLKVIPKRHSGEKLGVVVKSGEGHVIIEYSDLPKTLAEQTDSDGKLRYRDGSYALHIFDVAFLAEVWNRRARLPFHVALKKVFHVDEKGNRVAPEKENAVKFESFIFDLLPMVERAAVLEVDRREEFSPLKNREGEDSIATVRRDLLNYWGGWLEKAGVAVPRDAAGNVTAVVEISPLFARNAEELAAKIRGKTVDPTRSIYLENRM